MTNNEQAMLIELERVANLVTSDDIDIFAAISQKLPESDDIECLRRMLRCLRDIDAGEVQYELLEACERFPIDIYITGLIAESEVLCVQAPQWFKMLCCSVLNSEVYVQKLAKAIAQAEQARVAEFLAFLKSIACAHPIYKPTLRRLGIWN